MYDKILIPIKRSDKEMWDKGFVQYKFFRHYTLKYPIKGDKHLKVKRMYDVYWACRDGVFICAVSYGEKWDECFYYNKAQLTSLGWRIMSGHCDAKDVPSFQLVALIAFIDLITLEGAKADGV